MEPIAVVGMGCRLPGGAASPEQLWELLALGRSGWCEVPSDRWNAEAFYHPNKEAKESLNTKSGYFLQQDIAAFDAKFFHCPPWEAHTMDPQQRILLETTYEALENAGIPMESVRGSDTSVFVGVYGRDFDRMGYKDLSHITKAHTTGTGEAIISNRISYLFDLKGASMTIDTGCSGSMVALHQACLTLKAGESRMAIVAGTELLLHPDQSVAMSAVGMINPNGRCYVFDDRGSGYARGEGVATVILKRLSHAVQDNDPIHSLILQSSLNQDGRTAGISFPNGDAQAALMRSVYASAGVDPAETLYVEAHGTGTQAGDGAEIGSISSVFCSPERKQNLYVGSVKANIGHLEAASGVAGLIKAIMVLKKNQIPPHIDLITPKPSLKLEERRIMLAKEPTSLTSSGHTGPRRVSLNSFGYGGTNCHLILEGYDKDTTHTNGHTLASSLMNGASTNGVHPNGSHTNRTFTNGSSNHAVHGESLNRHSHENGTIFNGTTIDSAPLLAFPLSAASESALQAASESLSNWLSEQSVPDSELPNIVHTLGCRRSYLPYRRTVLASTVDELQSELGLGVSSKTHVKASSSVKLTMAFTGQGAQWYAMGRELLSSTNVFRTSMLSSSEIIRQLGAEWSLVDELQRPEDSSRVGESMISQPSTTAIQIALVDLLASWGIRPAHVVGHSSGEIAAAYAAGVLSQDAAMTIAYHRGRFSALAKQVNEPGAMMAVGASEASITPKLKLLRAGIAKVACVNSPDSVTISGDAPAIEELQKKLKEEDIFARILKVDTAYHSHHMQKIAADYMKSLEDIQTGEPREGVRFYSSVTGSIKWSGFGAAYWTENLVSKVRFSDALLSLSQNAAKSGGRSATQAFVEVGPHSALQGPIRQTLSVLGSSFKSEYVPSLSRGQDAIRTVLAAAGRLFECSWPVDWKATIDMQAPQHGALHTIGNLPSYPWDHETKYWWESRLSRDHRLRQFPNHDLVGLLDVASSIHEPRWRYHLNVKDLPWLKHHVVDGNVVFPGAGYLCMAIEALKQLVQLRSGPEARPVASFVVRNATFLKPIILPPEEEDGLVTPTVEVQLVLSRDNTSENSPWEMFRVLSFDPTDNSWSENCTGTIRACLTSDPEEVEGPREEEMSRAEQLERLERIKAKSTNMVDVSQFYKDLKDAGNDYGPTFAPFTDITTGDAGTTFGFGNLTIPNVRSYMPAEFIQPHVIHPSTLDAISHIGVLLFKRECSNSPLMLVFLAEMFVSADIFNTPEEQLQVAVQIQPKGKGFAAGDTLAFQQDKKSGELSLTCRLSGFQLRAIGDEVENTKKPFHRRMNYRMTWKEDVEGLTNDSLRDLAASSQLLKAGDLLSAPKSAELVAFVSALAFKNPRMKILEMSKEGTGPDSSVLEILHRYGTRLFSEYHYGISSSKDLSRKEIDSMLGAWKHTVETKQLDLLGTTFTKAKETSNYDLLVATDLVSASDVSAIEILTRLRSLLKNDGRLVILESDDQALEDSFDDLLKQTGFSGLELSSHEQHSKSGLILMISSAVDEASTEPRLPAAPKRAVQILHASDLTSSHTIADHLASSLQEREFQCQTTTWDSNTDAQALGPCIVLDNANDPVLESPTASMFDKIKRFLLSSRNILWISFHDEAGALTSARKGLITGMARVVRRENAGIRFVTLDVRDTVGSDTSTLRSLIDVITSLIDRCFPSTATTNSEGIVELEYAVNHGRLLVPRVHADTDFNSWSDRVDNTAEPGECKFQDPSHPLKVVAETPGLLSSLSFVRDPVPLKNLAPDEIQLEAKAYGVNFRDVFIALGQMPDGLPMAGEVAGIITAVGSSPEAQSLYKVGDRVVGVGGQPFSSHPRLKALRARTIPDSISMAQAASVPLVFLTAYYGLVELARMEPGETVLIQAASGGVGQAAIQIAKSIGATIFATVGSLEKRALIMEKYGIPESHIFSSRAKSFKQGIMRLTANRGVDVVLNSLAGEMLTESWECLAPLGTHIEIGKADIYKRSHLSMVPFDKNVTFTSIDLLVLFDERPKKMHDIFGKILDVLARGAATPVFPFKVFGIHQIEQSFRLIAERKHTGKVILEIEDNAVVTAELPPPPPLELDPNGTYVVAGGLGDLGRRLCALLARHGAGHVVPLSRRVLDDEARSEFERSIADLGAKAHPTQCDIVDRAAVDKVKDHIERLGLPPVKGIIHGGMVLRDHPLEHMDYDDYVTSLGPKVSGTINLSDVFASPNLDFFITMSSVSAILGKSGQANYSTGNSFQDAFARANTELQQETGGRTRYVSLNLGAIDGSEAITSLPIRQQELMRQGAILMSFDELFRVFEYAMGSQTKNTGLSQSIMGFDRESMTKVEDEMALSNPMFSMVPYLQSDEGNSSGGTGKRDLAAEMRKARSADEAVEIVSAGILEKLAMFLGRSPEDLGIDVPISALGLDSLVSIELKNWMARSFQVTLQMSDFASQGVDGLSRIIVSKAKGVGVNASKENGPQNEEEASAEPKAGSDSGAEPSSTDDKTMNVDLPGHGRKCCRHNQHLRRYPLPDLAEELYHHMENIAHFATSPEELENHKKVVDIFLSSESEAPKLMRELQAEAEDPSTERWREDDLLKLIFLEKRQSAQHSSFLATHHDTKPGVLPHTQAERAAIITTTAFQYKRALDAGTLEPRSYFGLTPCSYYEEEWLYNTCRLPAETWDEIKRYPGHDHCVVLRQGRFFKLALVHNDGSALSLSQVHHFFDVILKQVANEGGVETMVGSLTIDERDSWAKNFQLLLDLDPENALFFETIHTAAFVVCLDTPYTSGDAVTVRDAIMDDGSNRWYGKGLQFIVANDGSSAFVADHTMIDGTTVGRMNEWVHEAIQGHNIPMTNGHTRENEDGSLEELHLTTTPEIDSHIRNLRAQAVEASAPRDYVLHELPQLGRTFLFDHGAPMKAVIDITLQLVNRLYHKSLGKPPAPAYEEASLSQFHHGRIGPFLTLTPMVNAFCEAAATAAAPKRNETVLSPAALRKLMHVAGDELAENTQRAGNTPAIYHLVDVLDDMWSEEAVDAPLFYDPLWRRMNEFTFESGMTDGVSKDSAAFPADSESFFLCYYVEDEGVKVSICGPTDGLEDFIEYLDEAADQIRQLIETTGRIVE